MNKSPMISVIIPLYDAEEYIENAIRSVLRQTFRDFEIIVVDDCSSDESCNICEKLCCEDERISLIKQESNQGVSAARNRAMAEAKGKYIAFLDADDEYIPTALEYLYGLAEREQADVVHTPGFFVQNKGSRYSIENRVSIWPNDGELLSNELSVRLEKYLSRDISRSIWNKLYRKKFLEEHQISFLKIAVSEDILFSLQCLCLADKYVMASDLVYIYWQRSTSVTHSVRVGSLQKIAKSLLNGLVWQKSFMDELDFFSKHPDVRHDMNRFYLECTLNWGIENMYPQGINNEESYMAVCKAVRECVGEGNEWLASLLREYTVAKSVGKNKIIPDKKYRYTFSIIMSVYNVAPWLREAVDSLLKQDIGFFEHVQIIFVDDGSKDESGKICDEYALRYPQNIIVIHKQNGGLGSARNEGLKYVQGRYVNFFDPDDRLSSNTLREVKSFFEIHEKDDIDLVAIPLFMFEGKNGPHVLNYKFDKGSRIINLDKEPECMHNSGAASFIRQDVVTRMRFDNTLCNSEDTDFLTRYFLQKTRYGVVSTVKYHYRKRREGSSRVQVSSKLKENYIPLLYSYHYKIINYALDLFNKVPRFVQFSLMYDIQWRIMEHKKDVKKVLGNKAFAKYRRLLYGILEYIDDDIICKQKHIWGEHFLLLFEKKYNIQPKLRHVDNDFIPYIGEHSFTSVGHCKTIYEFLRVKEDCLYLEGVASFMGVPKDMDVSVYLQVNGKYVECTTNKKRIFDKECLGEYIYPSITFCGRIEDIYSYSSLQCKVFMKIDDIMVERYYIRFGEFFPVSKEFKESYAVVGKWIVQARDNRLCFRPAKLADVAAQEEKFIDELSKRKEEAAKEAIFYRNAYHAMRPFIKKQIWLLSDRINKADDNAEAMFKYISKNSTTEKVYFILRKDSADFQRVSRYGEVLEYQSYRHKMMHLLANKIISSAAEGYIRNPFGAAKKYYRDILNTKKIIFLQHGITKDDVSEWLNRYNQNLSMIVTAAEREMESFLTGMYFYKEDVIKLTGFPRYDYLENHDLKQVTIMPTWRKYLAKNINFTQTGLQSYDKSFTESRYFKFYNQLLNNEKLRKTIKAYGYTLHFMPHPNLASVLNIFDIPTEVVVHSTDTRYGKIFSESSLVVTDYSSTAFDFAYLRKPVVYCQFDKEEFFTNHSYKQGFFSYEDDGFGEVEYDLDGTVNRIIEYISNGCELKDKYRKRIDKFFTYHDKKNCERVYTEIRSL